MEKGSACPKLLTSKIRAVLQLCVIIWVFGIWLQVNIKYCSCFEVCWMLKNIYTEVDWNTFREKNCLSDTTHSWSDTCYMQSSVTKSHTHTHCGEKCTSVWGLRGKCKYEWAVLGLCSAVRMLAMIMDFVKIYFFKKEIYSNLYIYKKKKLYWLYIYNK